MVDQIGVFAPIGAFKDVAKPAFGVAAAKERVMIARRFNMHCRQTYDGIYFTCSLPKQLKGTNVEGLRFTEVGAALLLIEQRLMIDMHFCRLYSIEVGATIPVKYPPSMYFAEWGGLHNTTRDEFSDGMTVVHTNSLWSFSGYDKGSEIYPASLPDEYRPYALRLEYKRKKRIKGIFLRALTPWDLTDPDVYHHFVGIWESMFLRIHVLHREMDLTKAHTSSELKTMLAAQGLAAEGFSIVKSTIYSQAKSGKISKYNASRMRAMVRDLMKDGPSSLEGSLSTELREKVIAFADRERYEVLNCVTGCNGKHET